MIDLIQWLVRCRPVESRAVPGDVVDDDPHTHRGGLAADVEDSPVLGLGEDDHHVEARGSPTFS